MEQTITITPKWQIYLPDAIREAIKMVTPGKASIRVVDNTIIITPKKSGVLSLAGKYRARHMKTSLNIEKIRDAIDYTQL